MTAVKDMPDAYSTLGVNKNASDSDIKRAYRKLAKELHPDLNPNDPAISERFKDVSQAYKILGDKELRGKYDRGEIDASGNERHPFHNQGPGGFGPGGFGGGGFRRGGFRQGGAGGARFDGASPEDIFSDFSDLFSGFGGRRGTAGSQQRPQKGQDRTFRIAVSFLDAARGTKRRISLPGGKTLDVQIPAGIEDGKQIRLKGQGHPSEFGGTAGDALIEVKIEENSQFRREGNDIHYSLPIGLGEAVLGAKIEVPTIDGPVTMTIPKGANSGQKLRLRGKGIQRQGSSERGDQYVILAVSLPKKIDKELEEFIREWHETHPYRVRD